MKNLLPFEGIVYYYPGLITNPDQAFNRLLQEIPWEHEKLKMFGKEITMRRMVSSHGDPGVNYSYSGMLKKPQPWNDTLVKIKDVAEVACATQFNSCLANLYADGRDAMGWHADNERSLGKDPMIASISLGATRKFSFRHNDTGETVSIELESGSLLVMGPGVQLHWKHALPASAKAKQPRINLTFRTIFPNL